jgi:CheY-like chemotaxis protein
MDNAAKYSYDRSTVRVGAGIQARGSEYFIAFANEGFEVRPEEIAKLKERGYRSDRAVWATGEGSGIGLWIVDEIMKAHGGRLLIIPTQNRITEVRLVFPLLKEWINVPMSYRVLLLEDDYLQSKYARQALEEEFKAEVEVETMSTESEFHRKFEAIAQNPPAVAVVDIMLRWATPSRDMPSPPEYASPPERAGLRCAQRLRDDERTRDVKLILYSVLDSEYFGDASRPAEAISLVKDIHFEELIEKIREAMSNARQL